MMNFLRTIWYVLSLRCEEAERVRSCGLDAHGHQRFAEWVHHLLCRSCRKARHELRSLRDAIQSLDQRVGESGTTVPSLDDAARSRIRANVKKDLHDVQGSSDSNDS